MEKVETITQRDIEEFDIPPYALQYKGEQFHSSIPEGAVYFGKSAKPGSLQVNKYGGPSHLVIIYNFPGMGESVGTKFHNQAGGV